MAATVYTLQTKPAPRLRTLLLDPPDVVHDPENDPRYIDVSPQHRAYMRERLYGRKRREGRLPNAHDEAGTLNANYGDEPPPPWRTTTMDEYVPKHVDDILEMKKGNKDVAAYIKQSHFTLTGPDGSGDTVSRTKRDFCGKDAATTRRPDFRETLKSYQRYPPIFRDEKNDRMGQQSTYRDSYDKRARHTFQNPYPSRIRPAPVQTSRSKTITHFTLGDDDDGSRAAAYETATKAATKLLPPIPIAEYERMDKKKSNVLDNPDGEVGVWGSVQRDDYKLDENLDRKTLIVDMTSTIKDLKATHFTLGNDDTSHRTSQYKSSFLRHNPRSAGSRIRSAGGKKADLHRSFVLDEDYNDRKIGKSSAVEDYRAYSRGEMAMSRGKGGNGIGQPAGDAGAKKRDENSSVSFGSDPAGFQPTTRSVTNTDFSSPSAKDPELAFLAYSQAHAHSSHPTPHYSPIKNDAVPLPTTPPATEAQSSYTLPKLPTDLAVEHRAAVEESSASREYLRKHHFDFGNDEGVGGHGGLEDALSAAHARTSQREHYRDPKEVDGVREDAAGGGKTATGWVGKEKCDAGFGKTLDNTVSRYPNDQSTYQTVSSLTYGRFPRPPSAPHVIHPPPDTAGLFIHPDQSPPPPLGIGTDPKAFTTVTRRSFVPPEVMRYTQNVDTTRNGEKVRDGVVGGVRLILRGGGVKRM
ncbi:hypothetical protein HK104_001557 [Borealophlyctis nickersoniae]|nr:hypothetical protein HK104_001557 [Borealophlyctis nickersoniae]